MQNKLPKKQKLIIIVIMCIFLLFINVSSTFADSTGLLTPTDEQYLELKAVEIKDVDGQNKQVIMQLWGHQLELRRF